MNVDVVVVAAGIGSRFEGDKIFYEIFGKPLIFYTLQNLLNAWDFVNKILVLNPANLERGKRLLLPFFPDLKIVKGGEERTHSVLNGVNASSSPYVLIHDGARPFIPASIVHSVISALENSPSVTPAEPVRDTLKNFDGEFVYHTVDRSSLKAVQTPQGFRRELIARALRETLKEGIVYTDETTLIEELEGVRTKFVEGSPLNFKVTYRKDIELVERMLASNIRIGTGFDIHKYEKGRKMILGGVEIPCDVGLYGHSDGDALTHAIIDALLGASNLGDIGQLFPDTDTQFKDVKSTILLEKVVNLLHDNGYYTVNIDAVVIAEKPKLLKYKSEIAENLARILRISPSKVSIKGKTAERMGFIGRKEGLAVIANALILEVKNEDS